MTSVTAGYALGHFFGIVWTVSRHGQFVGQLDDKVGFLQALKNVQKRTDGLDDQRTGQETDVNEDTPGPSGSDSAWGADPIRKTATPIPPAQGAHRLCLLSLQCLLTLR